MNRVAAFLRPRHADLFGMVPDAHLLARYTEARDQDAFAEIVRRHGGLVYGVCRRMLADPADVDDAVQATFLTLTRKADTLSVPTSLAPWLHKVAAWTARNARRSNHRRQRFARPLPLDLPARPTPDLAAELDEALLTLPQKYREPVVLCHLYGWTQADAARHLGLPVGTLSARVSRGLARLRAKLGDALPALLAGAAATIPAELATATSVGLFTPAGYPLAVIALSTGVLRMFWTTKLLALTAMLATGTAIVTLAQAPAPQAKPAAEEKPAAKVVAADDKKPPAGWLKPRADAVEDQAKVEAMEYEINRLNVRLGDIRRQRNADVQDLSARAYIRWCQLRDGHNPDCWEFVGMSRESDPGRVLTANHVGETKDKPMPRSTRLKHISFSDYEGLLAELRPHRDMTGAFIMPNGSERRGRGYTNPELEDILTACKVMGYKDVYCTAHHPETGALVGPPGLLEKLAVPVKPLDEGETPAIVKLDLSKYEPPARLRKK